MKYFRGELINKQMYEQAFEQSNVFWFLKQYELKGRYGVYDTHYSDIAIGVDSLESFPTLPGVTNIYPQPLNIHVYDYRGDNIEDYWKPNYAFGNQKDLVDAALLLKLQGHKVIFRSQIG